MFVSYECCVLSGRGLCDELIISPEESYRLWCIVVCDLETSRMRRPWPALGHSTTANKINSEINMSLCLINYFDFTSYMAYIRNLYSWRWKVVRWTLRPTDPG
jgi:hypothetical protein